MKICPISIVNNNYRNLPFGENQENTSTENKPMMSTETKVLIGAGLTALAAVTIGVLLHKNNVVKKAARELEKLKENIAIEKNILINTFKGKASEEELTIKLAEIDKLPYNEQVEACKKLSSVGFGDIEALKWARKGDCTDLKRGMKEIPSDVKAEIDKGNWIKAVELYEVHVQNLPGTVKAKCARDTVEETIANLPWAANSKVKPHTYDLAKEGEEIESCTYHGKYHPVTTTKEGILYSDVKHKTSVSYDPSHIFAKGASTISEIDANTNITHGLSKNGKYVTIIKTNDGLGNTALGLISKNNKPSPAQEDLLSLVEHPERFDMDLIDKLCDKTSHRPESAPNFDYDLALSIIQSMARGQV